MKHGLLYAFGFVALGLVGSAQGQTTANGPYYANPSWDQQLPASTRFVVLSNWIDASYPSGGAAVLDRETGLVWERSPNTLGMMWQDAQSHCNNLRVGNRKGWQLPTLQELASLVDPTVSPPGPTLPAGHPFISVEGSFARWSGTSLAGDPTGAFVVDFDTGNAVSTIKVATSLVDRTLGAWCVRGGLQPVPQ